MRCHDVPTVPTLAHHHRATSVSIRLRLGLLFIATLVVMFSLVLYTNHLYQQSVSKNLQAIDEYNHALHISHHIQIHLQAERNAFQNVLLRGLESGVYHRYLTRFYDEERRSREAIEQLIQLSRDNPQLNHLLKQLQAEHQKLGRTLRQAIHTYNQATGDPHLAADAVTQEVEGEPERLIQQITLLATQQQEQQRARLADELKQQSLMLMVALLLSGGLAGALFIWLVDRQVGRPAEQASFLANYDALTGLPNRSLFQDRLQHAMAQSSRRGGRIGLLFVDLDHFKAVNDDLGHHAGDELLRQAATRLRECVRKSDTPARLSGDEFAVILEDLVNDTDASHIAQQIRDTMLQPFHIDGHLVNISASIGITFFPDDADDMDSLLRQADAAMYLAKQEGRNGYRFFTVELNTASSRRLASEQRLSRALEQGDFQLNYQPQIVLPEGKVIGAEALLRLRDGERLILAREFIDVLADSRLVLQVGQWVIAEACQQARDWQQQHGIELRITVNICMRQLRDEAMVDSVRKTLAETGLPAHCLELEVTERCLTEAGQHSNVLAQLKALGVRIAIDNFGTGYSCLSALKHHAVDVLKIDSSLIADARDNPEHDAVISAIIAMAEPLQVEVIAEGVEIDEQLDLLIKHGCSRIQGHLIGDPMSAEAFDDWLINMNSGSLGHPWKPGTR